MRLHNPQIHILGHPTLPAYNSHFARPATLCELDTSTKARVTAAQGAPAEFPHHSAMSDGAEPGGILEQPPHAKDDSPTGKEVEDTEAESSPSGESQEWVKYLKRPSEGHTEGDSPDTKLARTHSPITNAIKALFQTMRSSTYFSNYAAEACIMANKVFSGTHDRAQMKMWFEGIIEDFHTDARNFATQEELALIQDVREKGTW